MLTVIHHVERIAQNPVDLVVEVPRPVIVEKTIEVSRIQIDENIIEVPKVLQTVVDTLVQNQIQTIEVVKPTIIHKVVQRKMPIIQEHISHVPKVMILHVLVLKVGWKAVEVPQTQFVDEVVDLPVMKQRHVPMIMKQQKTVEISPDRVL